MKIYLVEVKAAILELVEAQKGMFKILIFTRARVANYRAILL